MKWGNDLPSVQLHRLRFGQRSQGPEWSVHHSARFRDRHQLSCSAMLVRFYKTARSTTQPKTADGLQFICFSLYKFRTNLRVMAGSIILWLFLHSVSPEYYKSSSSRQLWWRLVLSIYLNIRDVPSRVIAVFCLEEMAMESVQKEARAVYFLLSLLF